MRDFILSILGFFWVTEQEIFHHQLRFLDDVEKLELPELPFPTCEHSNCYLTWYLATYYPAGPHVLNT